MVNSERLLLSRRQSDLRNSLPFLDFCGNEISIPVYSKIELPEDHCSAFARMAAKDIFGKDYVRANALDRIYSDNIIAKIRSFGELRELSDLDILKPGMIVGVKNFFSKYAFQSDKLGNPRQYTHVMLSLGKDEYGHAAFCEQWGDHINVQNLPVISKKRLSPRYVFDVRDK